MGRKKAPESKEEDKPAPVETSNEPDPEEEDSPVVKKLKEIDDEYLAIEREYLKEVQELQKKYITRQAPILEKRLAVLKDPAEADAEAAKTGTPAIRGFWLQAMKNLPALEDQIEEWDEPVLEYLSDIRKSYLDESDLQKGFKLSFHFVENPYFEETEIWKEYHTEEESPYTGSLNYTEIKASEITWKSGKNVTVETIKKKVKGGGAKKANKKKEKEEPRDSFFRNFFRNLKPGMPIPDDVNLDEARQLCDDSEEEDEEEMMNLLMENDYEIGCSVRDHLVPFAVRWYTGEAAPEDDYDDEDEEEEEDDDDDEDDESEEESEDEPAPKKKGQQKKRPSDDKKGGQAAGGDGKKAEECKQQ